MTVAASRVPFSSRSYAAAIVGLGSFIAFVLMVEAFIRISLLNRFIIPLPSEIIASFGRLFLSTNADAAVIAEFMKHVDEYMALHKKLESTIPALPKDASPQQIDLLFRPKA